MSPRLNAENLSSFKHYRAEPKHKIEIMHLELNIVGYIQFY